MELKLHTSNLDLHDLKQREETRRGKDMRIREELTETQDEEGEEERGSIWLAFSSFLYTVVFWVWA